MLRRRFLAVSLGTTATGLFGCYRQVSPGRKRILVLGGTNFVGPAIVEEAMSRGHEVTIFNRGISRPDLFPTVEKLRGERVSEGADDLESLGAVRRWDAVIDVWPEESALVGRTAALLADRTDYYFFVSSISVYRSYGQAGMAETASTRFDQPNTYGGEKAVAERMLEAAFPNRHGIARCHAIVGPRDDGTAYHYWLRRFAEQDAVLAPGSGADPVQFVDVRDVAAWTIGCVEQKRSGAHNLCGPADPMSLREFLEETRDAIGSAARVTWVDADYLREQKDIVSFSDMPFWAPLDEDVGFNQISSSKALAAGMTYRPIRETAQAAWQWYRSHFFRDVTFPAGGMGISRERELEILDDWKSANATG